VRLKGFQSIEGKSWFVCRKDTTSNTLYVSQNHDHPWLISDSLATVDACWVSGHAPEVERPLGFKTRYRQIDAFGQLADATPQSFAVWFDEPQWAVTPGQSVVAYDGEVCLGGGIIA
jgi:tRNA-specific 2-thiouridylase